MWQWHMRIEAKASWNIFVGLLPVKGSIRQLIKLGVAPVIIALEAVAKADWLLRHCGYFYKSSSLEGMVRPTFVNRLVMRLPM